MADISFNIACKELKIAQIAQVNQIFQLLHLVHIYGHGFFELSRMLGRKQQPVISSFRLLKFLLTGLVRSQPEKVLKMFIKFISEILYIMHD